MKKSVLKLPKLKTRDELLRTAPELGRFLAASDAEAAAHAAPSRAQSPLKARPRSPNSKRPASPKRLGRKFSDDETTEEERVRAELERMKQERAALLDSLAKLRADQGKSGGELQQEDIRLLRRELDAKKEKLNELRRATNSLTETLEQLETTSRDCEQLMPQAMADLQARVEQLLQDLAAVEQDIVEAEAKHELYKLLEIRTRRDHAASEQCMRESRALQEGAAHDFTTLTKQMHEMRAAKEDAERELGAVVMMYDQVRSDWNKKLKDRRKEVRELERRKAEDARRKEQQAALAAEKARIEEQKTARSKAEHDAARARLSAVVPELEVLEANWSRLHGICGASTAEDLIAYWQELKTKEASMRELVRLAEVRETRAKEEMMQLLAERAEVFDTDTARGARRQVAQDGMGSNPAVRMGAGDGAAAAQAERTPGAVGTDAAEGQAPGTGDNDGSNEKADAGAVPDGDDMATGNAEPSSSQQGWAASSEQPGPVAAAVAPEIDAEHLLRERQALIAEARRRKQAAKEKFAKLSQVCVAADQGLHLLALRLKAAMEGTEGANRRRTSVAGRRISSLHRRTTGQHQVVRRMSAANLMERRASIQLLPVPGEGTPRVPQGSSIHDRDFFPELPSMLTDVGGRLNRLMLLVEEMQAATVAADAAIGAAGPAAGSSLAEGSMASSSFMSTEASEAAAAAAAGSLHASSKKLQWADGQATPRVQEGEEQGQGSAEEEAEGSGDEDEATAGQAAVDGEKALRKGFRRRTWAGPAWLNAVSASKPLTAALRNKKLPASPAAAGAGVSSLQRIVGYVADGMSSEEREAGSNPFDLGSSEDEMEEGDGVVDRQYLKHRAHKLTHPKVRGKQAASTIEVNAR